MRRPTEPTASASVASTAFASEQNVNSKGRLLSLKGKQKLLKVALVSIVVASVTTLSLISASSSIRSLRSSKQTIQPVACAHQLSERTNPNFEDVGDPNQGMEESPKRYVDKLTTATSNPPFTISLHKKWFDKMRWASIMNHGEYYETGLTHLFSTILIDQPKGLVIDIGMNIGWFTLLSRSLGHDVVAFDPNPIMHTRVCESLQHNGDWMADHSVTLFAYGLGDRTTTLNLTMGKNPGGSSFHADRLAKKFRRQRSVPVVRLDDVAAQEGWMLPNNKTNAKLIHLLKVDVEGFESFVFKGATKLLNSGAIQNIILESSVVGDVQQVSDLLTTIHQAGYKVQQINSVNGNPYHPEMVPGLNAELERATVGMDVGTIGTAVRFLGTVTTNLWWVKQQR